MSLLSQINTTKNKGNINNMGDSWRFDPYKDYTNDDSEESNFRRFKKSKRKPRQNDRDYDDTYDGNKSRNKNKKFPSRKWR